MYEDYLRKALNEIIIARQALNNFKLTHIKDMKNTASYHTQQAMEFIIKYSIYNHVDYNKNNSDIHQIYSHDLNKLIKKYCIPYKIYVPKKIIKNAKMYTGWEAESRYSLHYSVRIDSIISALKETESWLIQIKPLYKAKIADIHKKLELH